VRCALIQLICDLPAARKISGFPGHSAQYNCSVCKVNRQNLGDLELLDDPNLQRTYGDHIKHASEWKEIAASKGRKAADSWLKKTSGGVRWSCLNELPYWDPVRSTVIDAMHLLFLGLCQFHWRKFWDGDVLSKQKPSDENDVETVNGSSRPPKSTTTVLDVKKIQAARNVWINRQDTSFMQLSVAQILFLLRENGATVPTAYEKKLDLVNLTIVSHMVDYRCF
jgi:hypothetical protein